MTDRLAQIRRVDQALRHARKVRAIERVTGPLTPIGPAAMRAPPGSPAHDPRPARFQPDPRLEQRIEPAGDE